MAENNEEPLREYVNSGFQNSYLTSDDKSWLGKRIRIHGDSPQVLAERYHLSTRTLKKYARYDEIGVVPRKAGRPPYLEEHEKTELFHFVTNLGLVDISIPDMRVIYEMYVEYREEKHANA